MATLVPPPSKRQKVAAAERAKEQQELYSIPSDLGSVRVQFFDQATGNATGPAVSVPVADANTKNLETLLNTLQGNVSTQKNYLRMWRKSRINDRHHRTTMTGFRIASPTSPTRAIRQSIFLQTSTTRFFSLE